MTAWTSWSVCTRSCSTAFHVDGSKILGKQTRSRAINVQADFGGKPCPGLAEEQHCNTHLCPLDCKMSSFGEWSACSKTCGTGEQLRERTTLQQPQRGGKACPSETDAKACANDENLNVCPVDCVMSDWGPYSTCTATCGGGKQHATRIVVSQPLRGGADCSPFLFNERDCNKQGCDTTDCQVADWSEWSACSTDCGGGQQIRTREITRMPSVDGDSCPVLSQVQPCNTEGCGCSHVRCTYAKHRSGRWRIRVSHSAMESLGKRHKCAFDYVSNKCVCKCWYAAHYLSEDPAFAGQGQVVPDNSQASWNNLVFHEAATGAATDETPAFKLVDRLKGQTHESIGYTNGVEHEQLYWNTRNSNNHRL